MKPLNHARAQRAIALLFLALVLVGAVVGLVRSFHAAEAVPHMSRPALTEPAPHRHQSAPRAGERR